MVKVGLIGLGRMGMLHLMNCLKIENANVVAAADGSRRALKKAKSYGVDVLYEDYNDLLKHSSEIDAVVISLPNFLHFESIQLSLEAGLHVFAEKPLANTVKECQEIVRRVDKSGMKFMPGHSARFIGAVERIKEEVDKGSVGNVEVATIEEVINGPFSHPRVPAPVSDWWFDPQKSGGGALLDIGYHMIDLFRFFVGESKVIFASLDHKFELPVEDGAIAILESSSSSAKGIINVGWYEQTIFPKFNFRVIIHGNAGYLSSDSLVPHNLYLHAFKEGTKNMARRIVGRKIHPLSYTYYYESYYKELFHFLDCVQNDTNPLISATDGLKTVELIHEAYDKSRQQTADS